jgi:hypothetical protein
MKHHLLACIAVLGTFFSPARAQAVPYNDCGTLVSGVTCQVLFQDSANQKWVLSNTGGFVLGDNVRVIGAADAGCITACQQGGCISVSSITTCVTSVGVLYCPGDGTGAPCPCANSSPLGAQTGCLNSLNLGGALRATGSASLAADTVVLAGGNMPNGPALYFQGSAQQAGGAGLAFGDGLLCAGGAIVRLGVKFNAGGASAWPSMGDPLLSVAGLVAVGDVRDYQAWYRDAATYCTSATFNLTNGLAITWGP